jgi:hypothetical protein
MTLGDDDELVPAGDAFDLTAMAPTRAGLDRYFRRVDVPFIPPARPDLSALYVALARATHRHRAAPADLGARVGSPLSGHHDRQLGRPGPAPKRSREEVKQADSKEQLSLTLFPTWLPADLLSPRDECSP